MSAPSVNLEKSEPAQWLELFVESNPYGQVSATVPVRWHIHPDLVTKISKRGFTNPHLLIVVRNLQQYNYGDEVIDIERTNTGVYIVPLTQELLFVNFTRPGDNEIAATIIDVTSRNSRALREWLRNPRTISLDDNGKPSGWEFRDQEVSTIYTGAVVGVEVPRAMFAPDPAPWKKKLVKAFFPSKENDQCHFRKRLIGAFALAIVVQLYGLFARPAIALWVLYFGFRKVEWSRFFSANPHGLVNERTGKEGTWWTRDKHGNRRSGRWVFISPIVPIVAFAAPAVAFMIFHIFHNDGQPIVNWGWWETVVLVDLAIVALIVAITLMGLAVNAWGSIAGKVANKNKAKHAQTAISDADRERLLANLRTMSLNRDTRTTLAALPKKKQTIALRFYDLKARVCRPFAR